MSPSHGVASPLPNISLHSAKELESAHAAGRIESSIPRKKNWVLTQEAFDNLLALLDPDPQRAGRKYETIRKGLITFFECRGSTSPEDHTDDTLNRVARRLSEGKEIYAGNPASYFYGVARNVLKEHWETSHSSDSLDNLAPAETPSDDPLLIEQQRTERQQTEQRLESLEHCLKTLLPGDRDLISEYYQGETSIKIQRRKVLAERLGIPLNALRIRALRIREKLEVCVEHRLQQLLDGRNVF